MKDSKDSKVIEKLINQARRSYHSKQPAIVAHEYYRTKKQRRELKRKMNVQYGMDRSSY